VLGFNIVKLWDIFCLKFKHNNNDNVLRPLHMSKCVCRHLQLRTWGSYWSFTWGSYWSFTPRIPLLVATSAFGLGRRR